METMWPFLVVAFCMPPALFGVRINSDNFDRVPLHQNATFNCTDATHSNLQFIVITFDGESKRLDTTAPDDVDALIMRNIFVENKGTFMAKLIVLATVNNNRTMIQCRELTFDNAEENLNFSPPITLNVIGPPSAPEIRVDHISITELELQWNEPFTWPGYPVLNYSITQTHLGEIVNSLTTPNETFTYSVSSDEEMESCKNFTFNVTAMNSLGSSEPGSILTGLPIAIPNFNSDDIEVGVHFTQGGQPIATITVQPPVVCDYQTVILNVELTDQNGIKLVQSEQYTGAQSLIMVVYEMKDGLIPNINYSVIVTAIGAPGNVSSESKLFNTTVTVSNTFDNTAGLEVLVPAIAGVAGGLLLLMLIVFIVIICCVIAQRKTKFADLRRRSRRGGCSEQRDSTYDYIDDYQTVPPSSRKNQYQPHGYALRPLPRPDSPYQAMQAAETDPGKTIVNCHIRDVPPAYSQDIPQANSVTDPTPNNDMHVTPGGSVVFRSRGSASSMGGSGVGSGAGSGEGEYTAMSSVGAVVANQKEIVATRHSVTLPENALPYNGQPNGEYRFTEC